MRERHKCEDYFYFPYTIIAVPKSCDQIGKKKSARNRCGSDIHINLY